MDVCKTEFFIIFLCFLERRESITRRSRAGQFKDRAHASGRRGRSLPDQPIPHNTVPSSQENEIG